MESLTLLRIFHPIPSMVTTAAALGFALVLGMSPSSGRFWLVGGSMLLAQFSISAANDWADRAHDAAAGRARPIPLGLIHPTTALIIAGLCGVGSLVLALFLGFVPAAIVGLGVGIGWLYDLAAKSTPFSVLPFALAFPLLPAWVGIVAGVFPRSLLALFLGGIPLAAAIHLADAIPDVDLDASRGVRTLAVTVGSPAAVWLATAALVAGGIILAVDAGRLAWLMLIAVGLGALLYLRLRNKWVLIGSAAVAAVGWLA